MLKKTRLKGALALLVLVASQSSASPRPTGQDYSVSPTLQARIDSHPHTRRLTNWGSRPDWSADSKRILFVSREYGDIFELDAKSGRTRPLSFHFPHAGIFRAYYLANGDILYTAPREHAVGLERYARFYESELWLLKADGSAAAVRLEEPNFEGVAVSRDNMNIVWAAGTVKPAEKRPSADASVKIPGSNQLWVGTVTPGSSAPSIAGKRMVLDCGAPSGVFAKLLEADGSRCFGVEPQNFVPSKPDLVTFTMVTLGGKAGASMGSYLLNLSSGEVVRLRAGREYLETEGVFADGKSTLTEHVPGVQANLTKAAEKVDLWQLALDGSGTVRRVTRYNALDPELKANQGVVSPNGRWLAFTVSTAAIERRVQGQGIGIFVMDLRAAGF